MARDKDEDPHPVDRHVGRRVQEKRLDLGLTQTALAKAVGVSFQQVQKYEKGTNRIGASRLQQIAQVLGVPVTYLFEGAPQERSDGDVAFAEPRQADYSFDLLSTPDGVQLAKAFMSIEDPKLRRRVVDLVNTLAESSKSG